RVDLRDALAQSAGRAGDQADLVVESVHGSFLAGNTGIIARGGHLRHRLSVRCPAGAGGYWPDAPAGTNASIEGSSTGTPSALQVPASHRRSRSFGVACTMTW